MFRECTEITERVQGDGKGREKRTNVKRSNRWNARKQRRDIRAKCGGDEMWRALNKLNMK